MEILSSEKRKGVPASSSAGKQIDGTLIAHRLDKVLSDIRFGLRHEIVQRKHVQKQVDELRRAMQQQQQKQRLKEGDLRRKLDGTVGAGSEALVSVDAVNELSSVVGELRQRIELEQQALQKERRAAFRDMHSTKAQLHDMRIELTNIAERLKDEADSKTMLMLSPKEKLNVSLPFSDLERSQSVLQSALTKSDNSSSEKRLSEWLEALVSSSLARASSSQAAGIKEVMDLLADSNRRFRDLKQTTATEMSSALQILSKTWNQELQCVSQSISSLRESMHKRVQDVIDRFVKDLNAVVTKQNRIEQETREMEWKLGNSRTQRESQLWKRLTKVETVIRAEIQKRLSLSDSVQEREECVHARLENVSNDTERRMKELEEMFFNRLSSQVEVLRKRSEKQEEAIVMRYGTMQRSLDSLELVVQGMQRHQEVARKRDAKASTRRMHDIKQTFDQRFLQLEETISHRFAEVHTKICEDKNTCTNAFGLANQRTEAMREELHNAMGDVAERVQQAELKLTKQSGRLKEELDEHSKAVADKFSRVDEAYRTFTKELVEECAAGKKLCHQRAEDMNTQLQRELEDVKKEVAIAETKLSTCVEHTDAALRQALEDRYDKCRVDNDELLSNLHLLEQSVEEKHSMALAQVFQEQQNRGSEFGELRTMMQELNGIEKSEREERCERIESSLLDSKQQLVSDIERTSTTFAKHLQDSEAALRETLQESVDEIRVDNTTLLSKLQHLNEQLEEKHKVALAQIFQEQQSRGAEVGNLRVEMQQNLDAMGTLERNERCQLIETSLTDVRTHLLSEIEQASTTLSASLEGGDDALREVVNEARQQSRTENADLASRLQLLDSELIEKHELVLSHILQEQLKREVDLAHLQKTMQDSDAVMSAKSAESYTNIGRALADVNAQLSLEIEGVARSSDMKICGNSQRIGELLKEMKVARDKGESDVNASKRDILRELTDVDNRTQVELVMMQMMGAIERAEHREFQEKCKRDVHESAVRLNSVSVRCRTRTETMEKRLTESILSSSSSLSSQIIAAKQEQEEAARRSLEEKEARTHDQAQLHQLQSLVTSESYALKKEIRANLDESQVWRSMQEMIAKVEEVENLRHRKQTHEAMQNTMTVVVDEAVQSNRLECFEAIRVLEENLEGHERRVSVSLQETRDDVHSSTLKATNDIGILRTAMDDVAKRSNELETRGARRDNDVAALRTNCESETNRLEKLINDENKLLEIGRAEEVVALKNSVWERLDASLNAVQNADECIEELRQNQTKLREDVVQTNEFARRNQTELEAVRNDIAQYQQTLEHSEEQAVKTANELRTEVSDQAASAAEERQSLKTTLVNIEEKSSSLESDLKQKESSLVQMNANVEDTKKQFDTQLKLVKELVHAIESEVEINGGKMQEMQANNEKILFLESTVQMLETKTANKDEAAQDGILDAEKLGESIALQDSRRLELEKSVNGVVSKVAFMEMSIAEQNARIDSLDIEQERQRGDLQQVMTNS